ncbi:MAG: DUF2889 domain-containing protein [Pseudomonadota bacterium]|nr:DUF2889 domain-containing protein [Pseudomonadota bacterium]
MPLPPPADRNENHLRRFSYRTFQRADGLWDIDATVQDTKSYRYYDPVRGPLEPGDYLHNISVRLSFDDDFTVREIVAAMDDTPYAFCQGGADNTPKLLGANLMKGWRKTLAEHLGGTCSCTHLREMLVNMSTVAFQTISAHREHKHTPESVEPHRIAERPVYLGGCHALQMDGPVVARHFPQFSEGEPN